MLQFVRHQRDDIELTGSPGFAFAVWFTSNFLLRSRGHKPAGDAPVSQSSRRSQAMIGRLAAIREPAAIPTKSRAWSWRGRGRRKRETPAPACASRTGVSQRGSHASWREPGLNNQRAFGCPYAHPRWTIRSHSIDDARHEPGGTSIRTSTSRARGTSTDTTLLTALSSPSSPVPHRLQFVASAHPRQRRRFVLMVVMARRPIAE